MVAVAVERAAQVVAVASAVERAAQVAAAAVVALGQVVLAAATAAVPAQGALGAARAPVQAIEVAQRQVASALVTVEVPATLDPAHLALANVQELGPAVLLGGRRALVIGLAKGMWLPVAAS